MCAENVRMFFFFCCHPPPLRHSLRRPPRKGGRVLIYLCKSIFLSLGDAGVLVCPSLLCVLFPSPIFRLCCCYRSPLVAYVYFNLFGGEDTIGYMDGWVILNGDNPARNQGGHAPSQLLMLTVPVLFRFPSRVEGSGGLQSMY